jgi:hypothetical protein
MYNRLPRLEFLASTVEVKYVTVFVGYEAVYIYRLRSTKSGVTSPKNTDLIVVNMKTLNIKI